jgi:hypothetical protein
VSEVSNSDGTSGFNYNRKGMLGDGDASTAYSGIACKSPGKAKTIVSELASITMDSISGVNSATARSTANMNTSSRSSLTTAPQEITDDPIPRSPHSASADHSVLEDSRVGGSVLAWLSTGAGEERGIEKEREKAGGLGAMVTVSDLTDHPSKPHSLVFFLRVPVGGQDRGSDKGTDKRFEVELEFEFDLLNDNAHSVVAEMKECEELSSVPIDSEHITRLFAPFVKAGTRQLQQSLSSSNGPPSSAGLARAVIAEVRVCCDCLLPLALLSYRVQGADLNGPSLHTIPPLHSPSTWKTFHTTSVSLSNPLHPLPSHKSPGALFRCWCRRQLGES